MILNSLKELDLDFSDDNKLFFSEHHLVMLQVHIFPQILMKL